LLIRSAYTDSNDGIFKLPIINSQESVSQERRTGAGDSFPRFLKNNDEDYTNAESELLDFLDALICLDELLKLQSGILSGLIQVEIDNVGSEIEVPPRKAGS
jgi:hypothetical protein